ncbi:PadR family transcriptional regulator [Clostridium paraputrificum]|uniref:PadR family transcriptional regulator n=1 Tax=Clostridium paraputrificum TaxID=29363 RepID=UPI003D351FEC
MSESNEKGALTEAVYYILLALNEPLHGYGIMQLVKDMSFNRVDLGPGTLYGALNTMVKKEWIEVVSQGGDKGKKEYLITDLGRSVVKREILRLQELFENGRRIYGGDNDGNK